MRIRCLVSVGTNMGHHMTTRSRARGGRVSKIGAAVRTGLRFARGVSRTATRTRKGRNGSQPLTYDNDFKTDYRYRRMPRRRRRRWRRFSRKVNAVVLRSQQGLKKVINHANTVVTTTAGSSGFAGSLLYSADGSVNFNSADIGQIFRGHLGSGVFNDENNLAVTQASQKVLHFESAQLEITMRNTGLTTAIVEVYRVVCRRQHAQTTTDAGNTITGIYQLGFVKQGQIFDIETSLTVGTGIETATEIGTTPFQSKRFCQTFKIYSRKKFQIAAGNTVSFILKDPRNRKLTAENCRSQLFFPKHTHGYFFQVYGVPNIVAGVPVSADIAQVLISETRKYQYRTPVYSADESAHLT